MRARRGVVVALLLAAARADGPEPASSARTAEAELAECVAAAAAGSEPRMEAAAARLEATASAMEPARPVDALVIRARVRTQCRLAFAGFMRQGAPVAEANELLERALALDPRHRVARYTLGMNHMRAPAFLHRTDAAVREFERLLGDHGDGTDPVIASTYLYLGEVHERQGRGTRALATWRWAARFPSHAGLREKARSPDEPADDPPPAPERAPEPPAGAHALPPIRVAVSTCSVDDPRAADRGLGWGGGNSDRPGPRHRARRLIGIY